MPELCYELLGVSSGMLKNNGLTKCFIQSYCRYIIVLENEIIIIIIIINNNNNTNSNNFL